MIIRDFDERYLEYMALLFVEVYSEDGYEWDVDTAESYLARNYQESPNII